MEQLRVTEGPASRSTNEMDVRYVSGESYVVSVRGHQVAVDQPAESGAVERRAALIDEDVCRPGLLLLLQPPQRPQFSAVERVRRRRAALLAEDVQRSAPEIEVFPARFAYFRGTEAMTVGDEDHGGVPVTMSIAFGGLDQLVDFSGG